MKLNPDSACAVVYDAPAYSHQAERFCLEFGFDSPILFEDTKMRQLAPFLLHFGESGVYLSWHDTPKKPVFLQVDFKNGTKAHRRLYGGGKGQLIAKAVGVKTKFKPSILDATAGQGGDAFVFASLGCHVSMLERSAVAYALLRGALDNDLNFSRTQDIELFDVLSRMQLRFGSCVDVSYEKEPPIGVSHDVVYLDPMFPIRKKSAAVKKEMRIFHELVGQDEDADLLLEPACKLARYRVVVKRPNNAPYLAETEPTYQLKGKTVRFDIYVNAAMPDTKL